MITVEDFLNFNKHCCETYHECTGCSLFGDDVCCVFRAKSPEDIPEVIRLAERIEKGSGGSGQLPEMSPGKKDPLDGVTKALKEIEAELHDMKRILDKRKA